MVLALVSECLRYSADDDGVFQVQEQLLEVCGDSVALQEGNGPRVQARKRFGER